MQLYDRGIRRRLAPMLGNDRRQLELAFSLLFSLPGTPMMQYGDEIGIGDNLRLPERECARTPMQWTADSHGGFSTARRIVRPVIDDEVYGYERVNVADQRRDPDSLLNWTERVIRMRKECPEISWGDFAVLRTERAGGAGDPLRLARHVTAHAAQLREPRAEGAAQRRPRRDDCSWMCSTTITAAATTTALIASRLEPYAWRWFRVGAADNTLHLSDLTIDGSAGEVDATTKITTIRDPFGSRGFVAIVVTLSAPRATRSPSFGAGVTPSAVASAL